jgi:hypothetical protein
VVLAETFVPPLDAVYHPSKVYPDRTGVGNVPICPPAVMVLLETELPPLELKVMVADETAVEDAVARKYRIALTDLKLDSDVYPQPGSIIVELEDVADLTAT